jgi:hypothetical protein
MLTYPLSLARTQSQGGDSGEIAVARALSAQLSTPVERLCSYVCTAVAVCDGTTVAGGAQ